MFLPSIHVYILKTLEYLLVERSPLMIVAGEYSESAGLVMVSKQREARNNCVMNQRQLSSLA